MKKYLLLFCVINFLSCSKSEDQNNFSSIEYKILGTGSIRRVQLSVNYPSNKNPRYSTVEFIQKPSLPFTYQIEEYYPNKMEIFVDLDQSSDLENVSEIQLIKDGILVKSLKPTVDDLNVWPDYFSIYVNYEWGVYLE